MRIKLLSLLLAGLLGVIYILIKTIKQDTHPVDLDYFCKTSQKGVKVVLVTGAAGFIGFHSALALRAQNSTVIGVDNFNNYYPVEVKEYRARALLDNGIPVVRADINDQYIISWLFKCCKFTHVLHLAAQAGVRYAARNPLSYVSSNIAGSVTLLEVIRFQEPLPIFVYASSSSVYGNSRVLPFNEDDRADTPASLYAASKRSQELIVQAYHNMFGLPATGLRFFTVYGPFGRPDMSVMSFTYKILNGLPLRVFKQRGGGDLSRDFTYIDDVVQGILGSIDMPSPERSVKGRHKIFNIGNTKVVGVSRLISLLELYLGRKAILNESFLPSIGEVIQTNADINSAHSHFNYTPGISIEVGLRRFIDWFMLFTETEAYAMLSKYTPD